MIIDRLMKKTLLFFLLLVTMYSLDAEAQRRRFGRYSLIDGWSITTKGGMSLALGELNKKNTSWVTGFAVNKGVAEFLNLRVEFETGILQGQEASYYNSRFKTDFYSINLIPVLNLGRVLFEESPVNIGVYAGIGTIRFNAAAYDLTTGKVQRVTSDIYSRHTPLFQKYGAPVGEDVIYYTRERTVPIGILLSIPVGERINAGLDFRYSFVRNDKLDVTSGTDRSAISATQGNQLWGAKSYSDTPNDKWGYVAVTLSYKFVSQFSAFQRGI